MKNLTIDLFRKYVGEHFFNVTFVKQDGTLRTMTARLKVKRYVKGTQPEITAKRNATLRRQGMIGVFEVSNPYHENGELKYGSEKYRVINLNTITRLAAEGEVFYERSN
jgi:hypothetical protein